MTPDDVDPSHVGDFCFMQNNWIIGEEFSSLQNLKWIHQRWGRFVTTTQTPDDEIDIAIDFIDLEYEAEKSSDRRCQSSTKAKSKLLELKDL